MNKKALLLLFSVIVFIFFSSEKIWAQKEVAYEGPIYNIFFHPLIVYPERAFYRANDRLDYIDEWFVTENEFKKIIPELYKRGFILVSPQDLFAEKKDAQGQWVITRKPFILPEGKKPLILSLDDYNFYKQMKLHGTVHRFWVDKQGKLATITNNTSPMIQYNQEIPQLLEKFIAEHPDFSFNHARGIIGLTGYNGIFGYNTHQPFNKNYLSQLSEAKKVVQKLKSMRWQFASHSYYHLDQKKQTEQAFEESEKRWRKEVGSIVGPTTYYIFPFGDPWDENATRMSFLKSMGYRYFFGVAQSNKMIIEPGAVIMGRFPMDGNALRGKYRKAHVYIDPTAVLDSSRLGK